MHQIIHPKVHQSISEQKHRIQLIPCKGIKTRREVGKHIREEILGQNRGKATNMSHNSWKTYLKNIKGFSKL